MRILDSICLATLFTLATNASLYAQPSQEDLAKLDTTRTESIELVKSYLEAYGKLDVEAMSEFYTDDVRFIDPTSENTPLMPRPFIYEGRDNVVGALTSVSQNYDSLKYDIHRIWESSGYVTVVADATGVAKTLNGSAAFNGQIVTVLKLESGLIAEHRDYFFY